MTHHKILTAFVLGSGALALVQGGAEARSRIVCEGNFQIVKGYPVSTPYCREKNLARVARSYGWKVSEQAIRSKESVKADVCRAIGHDNRVEEICAPYRIDGGSNRFPR
jgi:hypothetical protein